MKKLTALSLPGTTVTKVSLEIDSGTPFETFEEILRALDSVEGALQWWIGDALNFGESAYGEAYAQAVEDTGYKAGTLANIKYVASRIEPSRRRENVSWSKHAEVAGLDSEQQDVILREAEQRGLSVKEVRQVARETAGKEVEERPKCPTCGQKLPAGVELPEGVS